MKKLEDFILDMNRDTIGIGDVLYSYWPDTESLEKRLIVLNELIELNQGKRQHLRKREQREERRKLSDECWPMFVERKKIKAQIKGRHARVLLAFNQLFLQEKVKMECNVPGGIVRKVIRETYTEMIARIISDWPNVEDYKKTEIVRRADLDPTINYGYTSKGQLICVGSEIAMWVWPTRITKYSIKNARKDWPAGQEKGDKLGGHPIKISKINAVNFQSLEKPSALEKFSAVTAEK